MTKIPPAGVELESLPLLGELFLFIETVYKKRRPYRSLNSKNKNIVTTITTTPAPIPSPIS
jgi:hypothetical protein